MFTGSLGVDMTTGEEVAIKFALEKSIVYDLDTEYANYLHLGADGELHQLFQSKTLFLKKNVVFMNLIFL